MKLKNVLKRQWDWYTGSQSQKELYIKTLQRIVIEQDKRIDNLEFLLTRKKELCNCEKIDWNRIKKMKVNNCIYEICGFCDGQIAVNTSQYE